jgi:hypothetical protein
MKQKLTWYSLIESYPRTTSASFPEKKHENRLKMESNNSMGQKFLRRNQISKTTQKKPTLKFREQSIHTIFVREMK